MGNVRPGRAINTEVVPNQKELKDKTNRIPGREREREVDREKEQGKRLKDKKREKERRAGKGEKKEGEEKEIKCTEKMGR